MDGARFANAVAALGVSPADLTWRAGVDVLSFGGTKNGCLAAEAVVFFDPAHARDVRLRPPAGRAGLLQELVHRRPARRLSRRTATGWSLPATPTRMAARLAAAIAESAKARLALEPAGNEVFAVLTNGADGRLKAAGARLSSVAGRSVPAGRAAAAPDESLVRLVTSWPTTAGRCRPLRGGA